MKAVAHGLRHIVSLTEVHNPLPPPLPSSSCPHHHQHSAAHAHNTLTSTNPPTHGGAPPPPPPPPAAKEDTIKTSSLSVLATCTNIEIRRAATKILCDRFMASPSAGRLLLKDLQSANAETVHRARLALNLLEDYEALNAVRTAGVRRARGLAAWGLHRADGAAAAATGEGAAGNARDLLGGRDPVERDLRRRRREAMVLNEGDRPVSQEDVWMRDGEGRLAIEEEWDDRM